jgi:hypothetical protein
MSTALAAPTAAPSPAAPPLLPGAGEGAFPPLEIRHEPPPGPGRDRGGLTLFCIVRDEGFFLPAFLAHYRRLGIARFVVLDDGSTDGSLDLLRTQPDVTIVGSPLRYGDTIAYAPALAGRVLETRAVRLWRDQLMNRFAIDRWAVVADSDEFLCLPEGMTLPDLVARLEAEGIEAVWGSMTDMYPARVADLRAAHADAFVPDGSWYFDGREHIRPRRDETAVPRMIYPGVRARLLARAGLQPQGSLLRRLRRRLSGFRYAPTDMLHKVPLMRWREGDLFRNCHWPTKRVSARYVLPIMHFKFTADLPRRIDYAIASGGYNRGSQGYRLYRDLLDRMAAEGGSFLAPVSRRFESYADFERAGIGRL